MSSQKAFRFGFELDRIEDIAPWNHGKGHDPHLSWYGLTYGRFWIDTPLAQVLRYSPEILKIWNSPFLHADHMIAEFVSDLKDCLPAALEAVPEDIARIVADPLYLAKVVQWCFDLDNEEGPDMYDSALDWWRQRQMHMGYLVSRPSLSFVRVGNDVSFRWTTLNNNHQGAPVFLVPEGCSKIRIEEFMEATYGFCQDLLSAMRSRVEAIQREGWNRTDCTLDMAALVAQQQFQEDELNMVKAKVSLTDWNKVRTHLQHLTERIGVA